MMLVHKFVLQTLSELRFRTDSISVVKVFHAVAAVYFLWLDYHVVHLVHRLGVNYPVLQPSFLILGVQFITVWCQVFQQLYFYSCFLLDILDLSPEKKYDNTRQYALYFKENLFPSMVFPLSVVVCINFWAVYNMDSNLLENLGILANCLPPWLNHALHTNIVILSIMEVIVNSRLTYPPAVSGVSKIVLIIICYASICFLLERCTNLWQYPFFLIMTGYQRIMFLILNLALSCFSYNIGVYLHKTIWSSKHDESTKLTEKL